MLGAYKNWKILKILNFFFITNKNLYINNTIKITIRLSSQNSKGLLLVQLENSL